jgi:hypothetical protein
MKTTEKTKADRSAEFARLYYAEVDPEELTARGGGGTGGGGGGARTVS